MKIKICKHCGTKLEESWNKCSKCGSTISESTIQEIDLKNPFQLRLYKQEYSGSVSGAQIDVIGYFAIIFGVLSSVFGLGLGLFYGQIAGIILEIIFAIFAMIVGGAAFIEGEISRKALGGLILGGINLALFWYFIPFIILRGI